MVSRSFVAAIALSGAASALPQSLNATKTPPPAVVVPAPKGAGSDPLAGILGALSGGQGQNLLSGLGKLPGLGAIGDFAELLSLGDVPHGPAPKGCSKFEILVARGTGEPGPFGAVVGDSLVRSIAADIPDTRGYSVQYPAGLDVSRSPQIGADDVINRLNSQSKQCPDQKFAVVGYSQGAGVMHEAFSPAPHKVYAGGPNPRPVLDQTALSKVLAYVMFGDPGLKNGLGNDFMNAPPFSAAVTAKLRENCNAGDPVCDPNGAGFEKHVAYISNPWQNESVAFIEAAFKGQPLPPAPKTYQDAGLSAPKAGSGGILAGIIGPGLDGLLGSLGSPKGTAPAKPVALPIAVNATKPAH